MAEAASGPFSKQQDELRKAFDTFHTSTLQKVSDIKRAAVVVDEATMRGYRADLDRQIEALHLAVSNYVGDCDRRKQRIEAAMSEQLDIADFEDIGKALCQRPDDA
jgi:hypothetical protein